MSQESYWKLIKDWLVLDLQHPVSPIASGVQIPYSGSLKPRWKVQFFLGFFQDKEPVVEEAWGSFLIP